MADETNYRFAIETWPELISDDQSVDTTTEFIPMDEPKPVDPRMEIHSNNETIDTPLKLPAEEPVHPPTEAPKSIVHNGHSFTMKTKNYAFAT